MNYKPKTGFDEKFIYSATQINRVIYLEPVPDYTGMTVLTLNTLQSIWTLQVQIFSNIFTSRVLQIIQATSGWQALWTCKWYNPGGTMLYAAQERDSTTKNYQSPYVVSFSTLATMIYGSPHLYNFFRFNSKDSSFTDFGGIFPAAASKPLFGAGNSTTALCHTEGIAFTGWKTSGCILPAAIFLNDEITGAVSYQLRLYSPLFEAGSVLQPRETRRTFAL